MARQRKTPLVIGVGGHAVALDPDTGTELWRTTLKSASFVTILVSGSRVFAGAGGELFCLDLASGSLLWRNKLKGLGLGVVAFDGSGGLVAQAALEAERAAAAVATT
jgi:outer membrane protein assembly factor BamB